MSLSKRDVLYADLHADLEAFVFDERVAAVFADMVRRSVPGYATVIAMTGVLAARFAQPQSAVYDLGCSLGATTLAMRQKLLAPGCTLIAVDNSSAMLQAAQNALAQFDDGAFAPVEYLCADIQHVPISNASVVALNFTLQFIPLHERAALLQRIYAGMRPGGVLILSEKMRAADPALDQRLQALHLDFKRANGYSELEISQKRSALEDVLIAETEEAHLQRLHDCGFVQATRWFQCLNFASWIAWKAQDVNPTD